MSKQPALYPAEAPFRDLRGAICRGDGRAALGAIERALDLDALQYVGDGLLMALAQGIPDVTTRAEECVAALWRRDLDGDEDLTSSSKRRSGPSSLAHYAVGEFTFRGSRTGSGLRIRGSGIPYRLAAGARPWATVRPLRPGSSAPCTRGRCRG